MIFFFQIQYYSCYHTCMLKYRSYLTSNNRSLQISIEPTSWDNKNIIITIMIVIPISILNHWVINIEWYMYTVKVIIAISLQNQIPNQIDSVQNSTVNIESVNKHNNYEPAIYVEWKGLYLGLVCSYIKNICTYTVIMYHSAFTFIYPCLYW